MKTRHPSPEADSFDPAWCMRLLPAFAALGAGATLWLFAVIVLDGGSLSISDWLLMALAGAFWSVGGAAAGMFVGVLSCSAATGVGRAAYAALVRFAPAPRRALTIAAQLAVLMVAATLATIWVGFSGGDGQPHYRGM